jgi:hypothetical protein
MASWLVEELRDWRRFPLAPGAGRRLAVATAVANAPQLLRTTRSPRTVTSVPVNAVGRIDELH